VRLGADNIGTSVATGLRVHVVRELELDNDGERVAPMHRVKTIGDHFRLEDYLSECKPEEYRSCARTVKIFDMSEPRGVFKPVDFLTALDATERFKKDARGTLVGMHADLARNVVSKAAAANLTLNGGFADMFLYRNDDGNGYSVAQVLGQMEDAAMPYETLRSTAETVAARLVETGGAVVRQQLQAGTLLINRIYSKRLTADDIGALRKLAQSAAALGVDSNGVASGNAFGAHSLEALESEVSLPENGGYLPPGFGSVSGLYTIAAATPETAIGRAIGANTIGVATRFTEAVDTLHSVASSMFSPDHMAFTGTNVPRHFKSSFAENTPAGDAANSKIAFAQSLIDTNKAPLYFLGGGGGVNDLSAALDEVDGVSNAEQAILDGVRTAAAANASPATRAAFASADSIGEFRRQYEQSPFASAYGRLLAQQAADPDAAAALRSNKSFELFATTYALLPPPNTIMSTFLTRRAGYVFSLERASPPRRMHARARQSV